jgi:alpha-glucosidase
MNNYRLLPVLLTICCLASATTFAEPHFLESPDGRLTLTFQVGELDTEPNCATYRIDYDGQSLVTASRLALETDEGILGRNVEVVDVQASASNETWQPVYGERSVVRDNYRELVVTLRDFKTPNGSLILTFRAYDEGIAWSYTIPEQGERKSIRIEREATEFRFPANHTAWAVYSAQGKYAEVALSEVRSGCERPLTLANDDRSVYMAVGEANLVDYARMKLGPLEGTPHALVSQLSSSVDAELPLTTPWRFVMAADSPGELLENNDLLLNLSDPCEIEDTSWIRPGKVIREVTLTTTGGMACVDFAVEHSLQYVEFDAGWYGHEYEDASDASTITVDPKRSPGPLDLQAVIDYAAERDIGIILYVNRRALDKQLDDVLPLYQDWGVAGLKYGFVNVGSQQWTSWLHDAIRKAADHELMIDVHDEYRPTGYSRTYPNFMTQEGIGGDETSPSNEQTLTILFTRMICGAGDNTICYYNDRVDRNASHAYQLAKAVCLYSPWQFVYWYDRPMSAPERVGGAGDQEGRIGDEPELQFFDDVPTVWDDTRVIMGEIGQYAIIARRSGDDWFLGCLNAGESRSFGISLDFLDPQTKYVADVYSDDPTVNTRTHVRAETIEINPRSDLSIRVSAQGGQAIRFRPVD